MGTCLNCISYVTLPSIGTCHGDDNHLLYSRRIAYIVEIVEDDREVTEFTRE